MTLPPLIKKISLITLWVVGFVAIGGNIALASFYQNKIYPGVKAGNYRLGGMNRIEATKLLKQQTAVYRLNIKLDSFTTTLRPADLGLSYEVDTTIDEAMNIGRTHFFPAIGWWDARKGKTLGFSYTLNQAQLKAIVAKVTAQQIQAPVNANITIVDGIPNVQADQNGLGIDKQALVQLVRQSLSNQQETVAMSRGPVRADVQASAIGPAVATAKQTIATKMVINYQDKQYLPSANVIGTWLSFTDDSHGGLSIGIKNELVAAYIKSLAKQLDVAPVNKKINLVNGEVSSVADGVLGTAINQAAAAAAISAALLARQPLDYVIVTKSVDFKTEYNRTISLDGKYLEINLKTQHLWAYQDHALAYDSAITSGATGAGLATVEGLFSIQAKESNRNLNGFGIGYNYNVFVQYWMPFYGNYGMHDASWRNGSFGGQDYYYGGSHGCVNLPVATAAWIYNWASVGTPVWVHQ